MLKNYVSILALVIAISVFVLPLQANDAKGDKAGEEIQEVNGLDIPLKRPTVRQEYLEGFQKNKNNAELLSEYTELVSLFVERDAIQTANDPKEARKAEEKLKKINAKIDKSKRSLFRLAKKLRKPLDKDYEQIVKKFNDFEAKAAKAGERGQDKVQMKYSQEAAKISQSMIGLKNSIDMINYHLFFDEYEPKPEAAADKEDKGDKRDKGDKGGKNK